MLGVKTKYFSKVWQICLICQIHFRKMKLLNWNNKKSLKKCICNERNMIWAKWANNCSYLPYCTKYSVSRSCDYTQTLMSMLSKLEVHTEHVHCAKLLYILSKPYKSPTQGASFHRVTWFATANIQLHVADNSQVDRTLFVNFYYFYYKTAICYTN